MLKDASATHHDKTNCCSKTVFRRCRQCNFVAIDMQGNAAQMEMEKHHTQKRARQRKKGICMIGVGHWYTFNGDALPV